MGLISFFFHFFWEVGGATAYAIFYQQKHQSSAHLLFP